MTIETHVLDNLCWHALSSDHAHLTRGTRNLAKRYQTEVAGTSAIAEHSEAAFYDLAQLVDVGETTALFEVNPPQDIPGWTIQTAFSFPQMVCQQPVPQPNNTAEIIDLTAADVPDMLQLIALAQPGPFFPRTIEMGRYIGIRQDGLLVAMAGQRFRLKGYCEISTVCTHPDWQGKGYARLLAGTLVNMIWAENRVPFLHVAPTNTVAIRLYESMNFSKRCEMTAEIISRS